MDNYSDFVGTNVRKLRDRMGMTQEEFAEFSGVSREQISRIENGRKKIISTSLYKIADAAGISVRQLMAGLDLQARTSLSEDMEKYQSSECEATTPDEVIKLIDKVRDVLLKMSFATKIENS